MAASNRLLKAVSNRLQLCHPSAVVEQEDVRLGASDATSSPHGPPELGAVELFPEAATALVS